MGLASIRSSQLLLVPRSVHNLVTQVKIMLPFDPTGKTGPKKPLPDNVSIVEPKEETLPPNPFSETKAVKPDQVPVPAL